MYLGLDLEEHDRIARVAGRFGERFLKRVYTEFERSEAQRRGVGRIAFLTGRFAAKEAVGKALGVGIGGAQGVSWQEISINRDQSGAPQVILSGAADAYAKRLCGDTYICRLSLSDTASVSAACVVLYGT